MGGGKKTAASGLNEDVGAAVLVLVSFTESELSESESEDIRFWKADIYNKNIQKIFNSSLVFEISFIKK